MSIVNTESYKNIDEVIFVYNKWLDFYSRISFIQHNECKYLTDFRKNKFRFDDIYIDKKSIYLIIIDNKIHGIFYLKSTKDIQGLVFEPFSNWYTNTKILINFLIKDDDNDITKEKYILINFRDKNEYFMDIMDYQPYFDKVIKDFNGSILRCEPPFHLQETNKKCYIIKYISYDIKDYSENLSLELIGYNHICKEIKHRLFHHKSNFFVQYINNHLNLYLETPCVVGNFNENIYIHMNVFYKGEKLVVIKDPYTVLLNKIWNNKFGDSSHVFSELRIFKNSNCFYRSYDNVLVNFIESKIGSKISRDIVTTKVVNYNSIDGKLNDSFVDIVNTSYLNDKEIECYFYLNYSFDSKLNRVIYTFGKCVQYDESCTNMILLLEVEDGKIFENSVVLKINQGCLYRQDNSYKYIGDKNYLIDKILSCIIR